MVVKYIILPSNTMSTCHYGSLWCLRINNVDRSICSCNLAKKKSFFDGEGGAEAARPTHCQTSLALWHASGQIMISFCWMGHCLMCMEQPFPIVTIFFFCCFCTWLRDNRWHCVWAYCLVSSPALLAMKNKMSVFRFTSYSLFVMWAHGGGCSAAIPWAILTVSVASREGDRDRGQHIKKEVALFLYRPCRSRVMSLKRAG